MKIALYQPWIYLHGGLERSIVELVSRSRHEWTIFTGYYDQKGTFPDFKNFDVRVAGKTSVNRNFRGVLRSVLGALRLKLPVDADTDAIVVWCDGVGDMVAFRNSKLPLFNICSTPLRAAFDPTYIDLVLKGASWRTKLLHHTFKSAFTIVDRLAWKRYDGIVVTSGEVKKRIAAGGLCSDEARMAMAYPGVDWSPRLENPIYEPLMLVAGRIMWTKNIEQAIRAFLSAAPPAPWRLVVAGYVDRKSEAYIEKLKLMAKGNDRIVFVRNPSDSDLNSLYQRASFCLFPPLNEDWGIVPLEAMAHGKPVVATARGGPVESVVEGVTGFLVEPEDDHGWARAINRLCQDPSLVRRMGAAAHSHVQRFSWDEFQRRVDDALERWTYGAVTSAQPAPPVGLPKFSSPPALPEPVPSNF